MNFKSDYIVTFDEYKEKNPMLAGDSPNFKKMNDAERSMWMFVMGLFG